ncbi:vacuolar protein sorting 28 family protein [Heterostelium album PN500]|uniref:Vacuolar protein sorting 28 family protein n=1 Tax=Heterostelium pallidum (strain ATCC 26659 / Pp 5 / PN500) TaxID=670386 RepID=D3BNN1_HETP5|nr:vacuolar protein sorting 28 family protein [Heterostelium album PN500]EFA76982.1 vacuolar protein sorting 28 family protein [Heterostelium album PN500]|eukprot:XP_020429113.1 vacuolar protein sorting 28 family protein [Heterostelium album PN500]
MYNPPVRQHFQQPPTQQPPQPQQPPQMIKSLYQSQPINEPPPPYYPSPPTYQDSTSKPKPLPQIPLGPPGTSNINGNGYHPTMVGGGGGGGAVASIGANTSSASLQAQIVTKEVKLCNNNKDREMYDNLAELYSIIKVTEHLEKAYIRDSVLPKDYTTACSKLIAQFKSSQTLVKDLTPNVSNFMREYNLDCKAAYDRLVNKGYPSTLEHSVNTDSNDSMTAKNVAETVQHFITTMDSVRLKFVAVDNIHPLLSDLLESLNRNTWLSNFDGKEKIMNWMTTLNKMKASEELDEDQTRQLLFDLDSSYNAFYKAIKH